MILKFSAQFPLNLITNCYKMKKITYLNSWMALNKMTFHLQKCKVISIACRYRFAHLYCLVYCWTMSTPIAARAPLTEVHKGRVFRIILQLGILPGIPLKIIHLITLNVKSS